MQQVKLLDFVKRYKGLSHQIAAFNMLEQAMPAELLERHADWVDCFIMDEGVNQPLDR
jgi:hypothetical protein